MPKIAILICLAVLSLSSAAFAVDKPECPGPGRPEMQARFSNRNWENMEKSLNFTDDQKNKVAEINKRYEGQIRDLEEKMKPIHAQIKFELSQDTINYDKIQDYFEQLSPYQIRLKILGLKHFDEIQGIMTPDQRKKMKEIRHKMLERPFFKNIQNR